MDEHDLLRTRANAELLISMAEIDAATDRMAIEITARLAGRNPLLMTVMNGGIVPTAMLLSRLDFPLQVDYIHLTRYGHETQGGAIEWIREPSDNLRDRTVLLVDDLLDHGITLQAAAQRCRDCGAREVFTAVLIVKELNTRAGLQQTDFFGLSSPDRYLFGVGMDYKGYWRNAQGVFALAEAAE